MSLDRSATQEKKSRMDVVLNILMPGRLVDSIANEFHFVQPVIVSLAKRWVHEGRAASAPIHCPTWKILAPHGFVGRHRIYNLCDD
jgi:hypothetical protein